MRNTNRGMLLSASLALVAAGCGSKNPPGYDATYTAGPFSVKAGTEIVMCTFVQGENAQEEDVQSFLAQQSVGGHHLIVYTIDHPVNLPPTPCSQGGQPGWVQVLGTQDAKEETTLPSGVGFHLTAHQQFVMETHFINASAATLSVQSSFSLKYSPTGTVTQAAHPYFIGSQNINIPPNSKFTREARCSLPQQFNFYTMAGHEHRTGIGVTVGLLAGSPDAGATEQSIYATQLWDSPPATVFTPQLQLGPSDTLHVTCNWDNTESQTLSYPQEMCYAVGIYWPGPGAMFCATGGNDNSNCYCGFTGTGSTGPGGSTVTVSVAAANNIPGIQGDSVSSGHPVYCSLFSAQDWPPGNLTPNNGADPLYRTDVQGVAFTDASIRGSLTFEDVTPGNYSIFCFMDTISGGFFPGTGDPANYPVVTVTANAGQTSNADVLLNFALP